MKTWKEILRPPEFRRRTCSDTEQKAYNREISIFMSPFPDDLAGLKDDMVAFIEGHGLRRFHGGVDYADVPSVLWKTETNPEGWKDFVELAKASGAPFVTMDSWRLQREELEDLLHRLAGSEIAGEEDLEDGRWLRTYSGRTGFVQIGFAHQGVMMVYEAATEWYERYQRLMDMAEDFGGITIDEPGEDEF